MTGALSFINPQDFEDPNDANGDGIFVVAVIADDDDPNHDPIEQMVYVIVTNNPSDDMPTGSGFSASLSTPQSVVIPEGTIEVTTVNVIGAQVASAMTSSEQMQARLSLILQLVRSPSILHQILMHPKMLMAIISIKSPLKSVMITKRFRLLYPSLFKKFPPT